VAFLEYDMDDVIVPTFSTRCDVGTNFFFKNLQSDLAKITKNWHHSSSCLCVIDSHLCCGCTDRKKRVCFVGVVGIQNDLITPICVIIEIDISS
jgi:hypothetical protein